MLLQNLRRLTINRSQLGHVLNWNKEMSSLSQSIEQLPFQNLPFNSVEFEADRMPVNDTAEFTTRMWATLNNLKKSGKSAVYLKIPILYSHYAQPAGLLGFRYHNAEGDTATMMMWLPDTECKVPPFATHHCGVGGAVFKDNKLLVVKEHTKLTTGWKLPGGYVNLGEELSDASEREVFEETSVKSRFSSILTIRQQHNILFGRSDMYIICRLEPLSTDISIDSEIETATWMNLNDFEKANCHPMLSVVIDLLKQDYQGLSESTMKSTVPGRKPFKLYHPINVSK